MKTIKALFTTLALSCTLLLAVSCASNKNLSEENAEKEKPLPPPPMLTEMPVIDFEGVGIKYEFESMLLYHFIVVQDITASGAYATKLLDESSTAEVKVRFPAGTYECLLTEKAYDNEHSAFYVFVDGIEHRVYPSNPPLGSWELTTRCPIYFTLDEPRTVHFLIQANSPKKLGNTQMLLDYIQFVKRD